MPVMLYAADAVSLPTFAPACSCVVVLIGVDCTCAYNICERRFPSNVITSPLDTILNTRPGFYLDLVLIGAVVY